jgi:predicted Zn-dependent protease
MFDRRLSCNPLFLLVLVFTAGCATVYNPAIQRNEVVFINTEDEIRIGKEVEKGILKKYRVSRDLGYNRRVEAVGRKIASVSDRKDLEYSFGVIESKDINAFALPGGSVYVTTSLLEAVDSNDELASVIGHEVGHIAARHSAKRLESQLGYSFIVQLAYALDSRSVDAKRKAWEDLTAATNITFNLITLGYSRRDELAADKLGLLYAEKAGYDPGAAITFLKKLQREEGASPEWLVFLRSHPYVKDRIAALEKTA